MAVLLGVSVAKMEHHKRLELQEERKQEAEEPDDVPPFA